MYNSFTTLTRKPTQSGSPLRYAPRNFASRRRRIQLALPTTPRAGIANRTTQKEYWQMNMRTRTRALQHPTSRLTKSAHENKPNSFTSGFLEHWLKGNVPTRQALARSSIQMLKIAQPK